MPLDRDRRDYFLSETFEFVGRRLYGDSWTGREIFQHPVPSPEQLSQAHVSSREAYETIEREIAAIRERISHTISESEIRDLEQQLTSKTEVREAAIRDLNSHPKPTDTNASLYDHYQRRLEAEATLMEAIGNGRITVHNSHNHPIDSLLWKGHPHFCYDLELSVVRVPRSYSARRFHAARIAIREFDAWLNTISPLTKSAERALSPRERCERFLQKMVKAGQQQKPKADYLHEARTEIRGLSKRTFEAVWNDVALESWKSAGRRRWPKSHRER